MFKRSLRILGASTAIIPFVTSRAEAHLVTTGLGPVYDGIGHLLLSPDDILAAVAVGLLAGLRGPVTARKVLVALPIGWLLGGVVALFSALPEISAQLPSAVSLLLIGALVACDRALPASLISGLAFFLGASHGFFNGLAMADAGTFSGILQLIGISVVLAVVTCLITALVISLRQPTARIVIRVAGSWIGAIGLLLLGWSLRMKR